MKSIYRYLVLLQFLILSTAILAQNAPAPKKLIEFILTPDSKDWNYKVNEKASLQVTVLKYGVPLEDVTINFEIGPDMLPADQKGSMVLKQGQGKIDIGSSKQPGFRQVLISTVYNGKTYTDLIKVGYSPEKITPTVKMPADFIQFWDTAKAAAANIPMDAKVIALPQYSTNTVDVFLVNIQNYKKGQRLYGYLCKPKAAGKYPVLFNPPGAGVKSMLPVTAYAEQGYISLSIEIHGISPLLDNETYKNISAAFGDYTLHKLDDRDQYYYKSVYLGCVRSIDFLCNLPDWDGKNVVVTGGSQGGALTIVAAALDKRVNYVAAFYPALCDMTGYLYGRAGGWPHLLNKAAQAINNTPEKLKTIGYYDVVNFAKHVTVPGFYSWGYNDNTCPPTSVFAAFNAIEAPKTLAITPISGHWRFEETNQESLEWLKKQLHK
ncbi:acetylxylan esterase [Pedobacter sp.]|uniref:acetylxylan esterase n=1 Tax=Pedobacter sp. TaxID=1411316 RepID=UPI003D7F3AAB